MNHNKNAKTIRKLISAILVLFIISISLSIPSANAKAGSDYITKKSFIETLVTALGLETSKDQSEPYISAAMTAGILEVADFNNNYTGNITRTDAAVLLNRADEYLHGTSIDEKLFNWVLTKRISDIKTVPSDKRESVAKCFAKGLIKGYSNGYYIQNRAFRGDEYLTDANAKSYIKLLKNTSKRAKLSPDGMLIRTTKLPKNASSYEYILECYPNKFYERKFDFMFTDNWKKTLYDDILGFPVQMKTWKYKNWNKEWPLIEETDKYLYDWSAMAEKYLNYLFNVDYRTVDDDWVNGLSSVYVKSNIDYVDDIKTYYLPKMKKNKVIVESSIIAVEPSTLYYGRGYILRAYVKYRISASDISISDQGKLVYATYPFFKNLKNGEWREGIYDIRFDTNDGSNGDGSDFAISYITMFNDLFNVSVD